MNCQDCKAEELNRMIALEHTLQKLIDTNCAFHNCLSTFIFEIGRYKQFIHEQTLYGKNNVPDVKEE